jgi:formylglycine-generating enzyme required for sulfatase activity
MNDYYALSQSVSVVGDGGTQMVNLTLKPQFATVTLTCKDPKAEIWVDDEKKGVGSWTGRVSTLSQQHLVTVKREGYQSQEVALNVSDGAMVTQEIVAPIPLYGMLNVESAPDLAIVKVDGKNIGTTPLLTKLLAGKHKIEIVKEGYMTHTQDIVIEHNKELSLNKPLLKQAVAKVAGASDYGIEMVYVQGGTFQMGSNDGEDHEKPVHSVTLDNFYIGKYEVTQAQWRAVMGSNPSHFKGDNLPVENVSWDDVQEFIKKLNSITGKTYRLPTEAEWEYAARGGNKSKGYEYSGSDKIEDVAWYVGNSENKTHPVGTKKPNELGVYDMSGNVYEWCQDWYGSYSSSRQKNPQGPSSGTYCVFRGGSWKYIDYFCRSANRFYYYPHYRGYNLGFRLVLCP